MGGGSQKQKTNSSTVNKPPKWFEDAAIKSLQVADRINQAGFVPYMGNEVAAFTPMQQRAMQSASDWMSASDGTGRVDAMAGMPQATVDGSGVAGYASAPGMMRNLELLRERMPKQYDLLTQFGGDLLANPSKPANAVANSPWNVGDTAAKASASSASSSGSASGAMGGLFPFGVQSKPGNNSMGGVADVFYSIGIPGISGGQIYQDQFNKALRQGIDPNTVMPWYKKPAAPAPVQQAPATSYVNSAKWW
jgi:hypothetical protein